MATATSMQIRLSPLGSVYLRILEKLARDMEFEDEEHQDEFITRFEQIISGQLELKSGGKWAKA
jgi:hypothetical protein